MASSEEEEDQVTEWRRTAAYLAMIEDDIMWYTKQLRRRNLDAASRRAFEITLQNLWREWDQFRLWC